MATENDKRPIDGQITISNITTDGLLSTEGCSIKRNYTNPMYGTNDRKGNLVYGLLTQAPKNNDD